MMAIDSNEGITGESASEQPEGLYYQSAPYAAGPAGGTAGKQGKSIISDGGERRTANKANAMGVSQSTVAGGASAS